MAGISVEEIRRYVCHFVQQRLPKGDLVPLPKQCTIQGDLTDGRRLPRSFRRHVAQAALHAPADAKRDVGRQAVLEPGTVELVVEAPNPESLVDGPLAAHHPCGWPRVPGRRKESVLWMTINIIRFYPKEVSPKAQKT